MSYLERGSSFFDLTGGESLPLVAFGAMAAKFQSSAHMYDIEKNQIYEYKIGTGPLLKEVVKHTPVKLDLDGFIGLYGGIINYRMHKDTKVMEGANNTERIEAVWNLYHEFNRKWPYYSEVLRAFRTEPDELDVRASGYRVIDELRKKIKEGEPKGFNQFLDRCEEYGILKKVVHKDGVYTYSYQDEMMKNCL